MRSEKEMMNMILSFAENDKRIRIVGMEGSRTNINVPRDDFQDYDISFLVSDMRSFMDNDTWLDVFGKRLMMQKPEDMRLFPPELGGWFSYLIIFEDGNKMDLFLIPIEDLDVYLKHDKLIRILLDKDRRIPISPLATDEDYFIKKPSAREFEDCQNEFWFVSTYVSKGLCRGEILFSSKHFSHILQHELLRMIAWQVGVDTGFSLSVGKDNKFLEKYLSPALWKKLLSTYRLSTYGEIWQALESAESIFISLSKEVGESLGYSPAAYGERIFAYNNQLKEKYGENSAGRYIF